MVSGSDWDKYTMAEDVRTIIRLYRKYDMELLVISKVGLNAALIDQLKEKGINIKAV